ETAFEPDRADFGAVVQLHADVDADVAQLPLDGLRDILADGVAGLRHQGECERPGVAPADPVRTWPPARLVEQRARPRRIERVARDPVAVRPRDRLNRSMRHRRESVEDGPRVALAIERVQERTPEADVGK